MKLKTEKYAEIVYDLAEANLFKLDKLNATWKTLDDFHNHLKSHELENLWNNQKARIVQYHL